MGRSDRNPARSGPDSEPEGSIRSARTVPELRVLLAHKDELETLVSLFEGDPLGLADRASSWMMRECFLLDTRKLALRAMTMLANDLPHATRSSLDDWFGEVFEVCALKMMREDSELADQNQPIQEPMEPRFVYLMNTMGFEPSKLRQACMAVNLLPEAERRAFHNLLIQRKGFGRYAREIGMDPRETRALLEKAILLISRVDDDEEDDRG